MGLIFRPRRPLLRLAAGSTSATKPPDVDPTPELERLQRRYDAGGLTDAEFSAAKARLLGS